MFIYNFTPISYLTATTTIIFIRGNRFECECEINHNYTVAITDFFTVCTVFIHTLYCAAPQTFPNKYS